MKVASDYLVKAINKITWGKKLPDAVYLHKDGFNQVPEELRELIKGLVVKHKLTDFQFNIIKFARNGKKISLLFYPSFFDDDFPVLNKSCVINLLTGECKFISYSQSKNPPILHRKETFLPPGHLHIKAFEKTTRLAEEAGLFYNLNRIGFLRNWLNQIETKGFTLKDGKLVKLNNEAKATQEFKTEQSLIKRHLTAIKRYELSVPMQSLAQYNFLSGNFSIFDYGCGKGDDLRELRKSNIEASGWDPVYMPTAPKIKSDVVNLGFVINVIEEVGERKQALKKAFELTNKLLVVSTMLKHASIENSFQSFKDGFITTRGTFQKYYTQHELKGFIEDSLDCNAVAIRPGVFFVFKSEEDEQDFLEHRQRRSFQWQEISSGLRIKKRKIHQGWRPRRTTRIELNQNEIEKFWHDCLEHGRFCNADEVGNSEKIKWIFGTWKKAIEYLRENYELEVLEAFAQSRKEDLLTYLALSFFGKRKAYHKMSKSMKRDIKELFTDYPTAKKHAKDLLFSVSNSELLKTSCIRAQSKGIGYMFGNHSFQLHTSLISQLSPVLRVYVGCATQVFGDIDKVDLVKIHLQSKKVSLMIYDDFLTNPVPKLRTRIKINLLEQKIDFFDYENQKMQLLYLKSRYLHSSMPIYEEQKKFDEHLLSLNLFDFSRFGPTAEDFFYKFGHVDS